MVFSVVSHLTLVLALTVLGTKAGFYWDDYHNGEYYRGPHSHFDCRRYEQNCLNGGDCYNWNYGGGGCYCPRLGYQEYTGYDCGINVTNFPNDYRVRDDCPCQNIHFCYHGEDGDTLWCACPPDYFGEDCSKNRVQVVCSPQHMLVLFNPIEPFRGIAYVGSEYDDSSCRLRTGGDYEDYEDYTYSNTINHTGCDLIESEQWFEGQSTESYTRQLTIQYDPILQSNFDLMLNVTCHFLDNGTWVTNASLGVSRGDLIEKGKEVVDVYFPVRMELRKSSSGVEVSDSVYLGEIIYLNFDLTSEAVYKMIAVESCTLTNSLGDQSIEVIEDRCPTERSLAMNLVGPYNGGYGYGMRYQFRAIRFGNDPAVMIFCRIRMCKSSDSPDCEVKECDEKFEWNRRKKREAKKSEDEGTVTNALTVLDPYAENGQAFKVTSADDCLSEPVVKSVGISLAVAVIVMVFVCIGLALCLCRMKFASREMALKLRFMSHDSPIRGLGNPALEKETGDDLNPKRM